MHSKNLALYVHWPWCAKKCSYCDFNSHEAKIWDEKLYFKCLIKDLKAQKNLVSKCLLTSIFFGGGTPSLISADEIAHFLNVVNQEIPFAPNIEITLETNPSSSPKFMPYIRAGINRFSIGVQALNDEILGFLSREHSAQTGLDTLADAMAICNNVNVDLIYGIPGQKLHQWEADLSKIIAINPQHISAYQLTIEQNSKFYSELRRKNFHMPEENLLADFFEYTKGILESNGYTNYEISNFCKPQHQCIHNTHVWEYKNYLGIGAGAHGRISNGEKVYKTQTWKMPKTYISKILKGNGFYKKFALTEKQALQERFLLGLRLKVGLSIKLDPKSSKNGSQLVGIDTLAVQKLITTNFLEYSNNRLRLTKNGWPVLDEILSQIFLPL